MSEQARSHLIWKSQNELIENTCNIYEPSNMLPSHLTLNPAPPPHPPPLQRERDSERETHVAKPMKKQNDFIIMDL